MRTDWTKEKDLQLVECVKKAIAVGFHKTQGPKRKDGFHIGFWNAVAIMMADGPESPTAGACSTRYQIALRTTQTASEFKEELEQLDDVWERIDVEAAVLERGMIEHVLDSVDRIEKMMSAMCKEWELKIE